MKIFLILPLLLLNACTNNDNSFIEYYSIEKSLQNISYGKIEDDFNFYKFQKYIQSVRLDSNYLDQYNCNFEDSVIYYFLLNKYTKMGFNDQIQLIQQIGRLNADNFNDSNIIVLDINDSISLISLSPEFSIQANGTCCSHYQNLIIKRRGSSLIFKEIDDQLTNGKLLGVYLDHKGKIDGLLIQGFSNNNGEFKGFNSTYNLKYKVNSKGIFAEEILNVRSGEPFDKNDINPEKINSFGVHSVYF
jgi:hypothetical protein